MGLPMVRHGVQFNSAGNMSSATQGHGGRRNKVLIVSKTVCDNQINFDRRLGSKLPDINLTPGIPEINVGILPSSMPSSPLNEGLAEIFTCHKT